MPESLAASPRRPAVSRRPSAVASSQRRLAAAAGWSAALLGIVMGTLAASAAAAAVVDVNSYRFDPLQGEPAIAPDLREQPGTEPALYLVQFTGVVDQAWKDRLSSLGADLYGYIPENAFIVRMDGAIGEQVRALPFVRWIGPYHTAYRISPEIGNTPFRDPVRAADPLRTLSVYVTDDAASTALAASTLGSIEELISDPFLPGFVIHIDPSLVPRLAALRNVLWVEERPEAFVLNNNNKWILQSDIQVMLPVWNHAITGAGQILAEMDTGLDYNSCWFQDTGSRPPGPDNRKVISYQLWGGNPYDGCMTGHGTHVAGTAVGDGSFINPGDLGYNGIAYGARLVLQDVGRDDAYSCNNGALAVPGSLTAPFDSAYAHGARVHTNSWGSGTRNYNGYCVNVDNYMWTHPDFLICFANGNDGPGGGTVGTPASAKDCISVGATNTAPNQEYIMGFSSRGPTSDGRYKPTISAPGNNIQSANNDPGNPPRPTCYTETLSGTSMATPAVAGCALLVRDYFAQGYYPLGQVGADPVSPSGALVKAMLVNSGRDMLEGGADQPSNREGWGRILLDDAMYFSGDTRELHVEDEAAGLATGDEVTYTYAVDSGQEPLEVTLVWTDYPAALNASPAIVNDLDLSVVSPAGDTYLGNVYSGGQSTTGGNADNRNVEECVRRNVPETGIWRITVRAHNVPQGGHQPFALVTTGSFTEWPEPVSVPPAAARTRIALEPARPNPFGDRTSLSFVLPAAGPASLAIYNAAGRRVAVLADGRLAAGSHRYEWDGRMENGSPAPGGAYFCRLQAGGTTVVRKVERLR